MSMSETNAASLLANEYKNIKKLDSDRTNDTFINILETILNSEFQNAETTNSNVDITTVNNTLNIFRSTPYNMAHEIAFGCCEYWSRAIELSGEPVSGTGINEIYNDAIEHVVPLENELLSIYNGSNSYPSYLEFVSVIFKHVRNIIWYVTEEDESTYETKIF